MKIFSFLFCFFAFVFALAAAQPVTADSWRLTVRDGSYALSLTLPDKAHAYGESTGPVLPDGVKAVSAPEPKREIDELSGEPESFYSGPGVATWILPADAATNGRIKVKWQVCVGDMCYPPSSAELAAPEIEAAPQTEKEPGGADVPEAKTETAEAGTAPAQTEKEPGGADAPEEKTENAETETAEIQPFTLVSKAEGKLSADEFLGFLSGDASKYTASTFDGKGFLMMLLLALAGGIMLNLTPCVLPLIPVNLAMIGAGKTSGNGRFTRVWHGIAYGAGITVTYGALGVVSALGASFGSIDSSWIFNAVVALIFVLLALAMFDVFSIDFSRFGSSIRLPQSAHFGGIFLMGALSSILAGACVAPVLIATLIQTGNMVKQGDYYGIALPFALGFGMALPWPVAAAGFGIFPKPGRWMVRVKQLLGVFILGLAAYYVWTAWTLYSAPKATGQIRTINDALKKSQKTGQPVLLDFTADYCKSCKVMEKTTFEDDKVKDAMERVILVKINLNDRDDPETKTIMNRFEVIAPPAFRVIRPENK